MSDNLNWYKQENTWISKFFPEHINLKIGIINWWRLTKEQLLFENIEKFINQNDINFFYSDEIIYYYATQGFDYNYSELFNLLNKKNVYYIMFDKDYSTISQPNSKNLFSVPWFYKNPLYIPNDLKIDIEYRPKRYTFNMLCGSIRSYRSLLYKVLRYNPKIYLTYHGHPKYKNHKLRDFLDESDISHILQTSEIVDTRINTMTNITRNQESYILSHVIPANIYNNSHFDIVTETFIKDNHHFVTEKTAKSLATGRFFCWYNSPKVKDYLSKFGFSLETYYNSYDNNMDNIERLNCMLDDIETISNNEYFMKSIYTRTKDERIHNMKIYRKNFDEFSDKITSWLSNILK
jgi:hypothetical protein